MRVVNAAAERAKLLEEVWRLALRIEGDPPISVGVVRVDLEGAERRVGLAEVFREAEAGDEGGLVRGAIGQRIDQLE